MMKNNRDLKFAFLKTNIISQSIKVQNIIL